MEKNKQKSPKPLWRKLLKAAAWIVGVVLLLMVLTLGGIVWILTPQKLTPLIEKTANGYIDGRLNLSRAELTVWKTFPHLYIDIDSLTLTGNAFNSLDPAQRESLPVYADTIATVDRFHGGVNVMALLIGKIRLYDVELKSMQLNAVVYDSVTANYNIVPPSADDNPESATSIPDITINRFDIIDALDVRYFSAADSIDVALRLSNSRLKGNDPGYDITMDSRLSAMISPDINIDSLRVGINGRLNWQHDRPQELELKDFTLAVNELSTRFDSRLKLWDEFTVDDLDLTVTPFSPAQALASIPAQWRPQLPAFDTDMSIAMTAKLAKPYIPATDSLPSMTVTVDIPRCSGYYDKYHWDALSLEAEANVNGDDIDKSVVTVKSLTASADGVKLSLNGTATALMTDPAVDADITASADFNRIAKAMKSDIPGTIAGKLDIDTHVKMQLSHLNKNSFHNMLLNGTLTLKEFDYDSPDTDTHIYTHLSEFKLGTNESFVRDTNRVDSLLTASVSIDTAAFTGRGVSLFARSLKLGAGCSNNSSSSDTTVVTPIGATFRAEYINFLSSDDSTKVRLNNIRAYAALKRYEGQARVPQLGMNIATEQAQYADRYNRLILRDGQFNISAHLRQTPVVNRRLKMRYDSLRAQHPTLSTDSIIAMMRQMSSRNSRHDYETLDLTVGTSMQRLLRQWDVKGSIKAKRGGMFTPFFPVRNRLSNVVLEFTTDSVTLDSVRYDVGRSDFLISGKLRNIRRAFSSGGTLQADLNVTSDSLNVNEIVQAAYAGSAFAEKAGEGVVTTATVDNTGQLDSLASAAAASGETSALLVPTNLRANISVKARNIIYSDVAMHDFNGELIVNRGAINLRDLSASSDIGSARLTALYSAPRKSDIRFGMGLVLNGVNVHQFLNMMPAVDSLMPLLNSFEGIIDADIAATADIDSLMNIELPSLEAAIKLSGRDLVLLDAETFRTLSKWLMFKDKKVNRIASMDVEMLVENSTVEMFPFVFDFDRYRLAVMGSNDLALNYKYHISVLKSPLPFKFGLNISGNADKMKIRLGGAKYKPNQSGERIAIVDTTRINLMREIERVFRRGTNAARVGRLNVSRRPEAINFSAEGDTISHADSLIFIKEGLIPAPPKPEPIPDEQKDNKKKSRKK